MEERKIFTHCHNDFSVVSSVQSVNSSLAGHLAKVDLMNYFLQSSESDYETDAIIILLF